MKKSNQSDWVVMLNNNNTMEMVASLSHPFHCPLRLRMHPSLFISLTCIYLSILLLLLNNNNNFGSICQISAGYKRSSNISPPSLLQVFLSTFFFFYVFV